MSREQRSIEVFHRSISIVNSVQRERADGGCPRLHTRAQRGGGSPRTQARGGGSCGKRRSSHVRCTWPGHGGVVPTLGITAAKVSRVSSAQARLGVWLSHRSGAGSGPGARRYGLCALHATPTPTPPLTPFRNKQQHAIEGQQNSANPLRMLSVQQHDKRGI